MASTIFVHLPTPNSLATILPSLTTSQRGVPLLRGTCSRIGARSPRKRCVIRRRRGLPERAGLRRRRRGDGARGAARKHHGSDGYIGDRLVSSFGRQGTRAIAPRAAPRCLNIEELLRERM